MSASSAPPFDHPPDACPPEPSPHDVLFLIDSLKKQVAYDRIVYVKSHMEENSQQLADAMKRLHMLATERMHLRADAVDRRVDLLTKRKKDAIDMQNGLNTSDGDSGSSSSQEEGHASAVLLGSSIAVKKAVQPIKLPIVERLPPYTTWIFLDRNQRMTEDQSVVGRRRIYYDQNGGEALIASDSEEEVIEEEEEKKLFVQSEDYILRMTINELGISDTVLDLLADCFSRKPCDIKARYEDLVEEKSTGKTKFGNTEGINLNLDKDLDAALDSFDNLFCRRCYVFDCKLHGCSQDLVFPVEKPLQLRFPDEEKGACGSNCYKLTLKRESVINGAGLAKLEEKYDESTTMMPKKHAQQLLKASQSETGSPKERNISESSDSENNLLNGAPTDCSSLHKIKLSGEHGNNKRNNKRLIERFPRAMGKKLKKLGASASDSVSFASGSKNPCPNECKENKDVSSSQRVKPTGGKRSKRKESLTEDCDNSCQVDDLCHQLNAVMSKQPPTSSNGIRKGELAENNSIKLVSNYDKTWKQIEKDLYDKGLEIFGNNSCLISRNLMNGLKTCREVFQYMNHCEDKLSLQEGYGSPVEGSSKGEGGTMGKQVRRRSRFLRRKGKARRLKYSWKSAGYSSMKKRISEKDQPCRHYNPCGCKIACGKDCPCVITGTCCEKYCGCPKSCKNRFRGCHCAKSQCRSRQCPCFAADRECDPDICRNCWIGCGDGTFGIPSQSGDNYECRNMKLLLKQQQRVLLGRSDVSGWGAFLKNTVGKHEYLGEYTGELITHREADKRGKIYDRENSSFLFNLNDQYVLDAYRKGDKLKFANHSPDPNCYAKVMMVAGDHRVGIFAKERICAGEELFYDYRYDPDRAPAWAKKPESSGAKKDDGIPSSSRARKHTS